MLNQLPFWCRECGATYESFNDDGMCTQCETPNVLERHTIVVSIPVDAFSLEDAHESVRTLIEQLIKAGVISPDTTLF